MSGMEFDSIKINHFHGKSLDRVFRIDRSEPAPQTPADHGKHAPSLLCIVLALAGLGRAGYGRFG